MLANILKPESNVVWFDLTLRYLVISCCFLPQSKTPVSFHNRSKMKTLTWGIAKHQWHFKNRGQACLCTWYTGIVVPCIHWFDFLVIVKSFPWAGLKWWLLHKCSFALWEFWSCRGCAQYPLGWRLNHHPKSPTLSTEVIIVALFAARDY